MTDFLDEITGDKRGDSGDTTVKDVVNRGEDYADYYGEDNAKNSGDTVKDVVIYDHINAT